MTSEQRAPLPRLDPLHALRSPTTWLAAAHLLSDAVFGLLYTFALLLGLVFTLIGLPLALVGIPIWITTAWVSAVLARMERWRFRVLLGVDLPTWPLPSGNRHLLRYGGVLMRDSGVRRRAVHQVLAFPLGMLTTILTYLMIAGGAALLISPLTVTWFGSEDTMLFGIGLTASPWGRTVAASVGLIMLLLVPAVIRGLAAVDVAVARTIFGTESHALAQRVDELTRSRARVVDAGEAERRRIERDLHDGTQQQLVSLGMTIGRAKARYRHDPMGIGDLLDDAHQQAKDAVIDLRGVIRGLHPPVLTDRGLDAALSAIAARCSVPVDLTVELPERPPAVIEAIGYFVVAEGLTNVTKHAHAAAATVTVRREGDGPVWITILDNGVGGADPDRGSGLRGLADRVSGVDGQLRVDSPVGGPTVLAVELPCNGVSANGVSA